MHRCSVLLSAGILGLGVVGTVPAPYPVPVPDPPELTAQAWIVYDVDSDVVLGEFNADEERPMASVTKLMTALVVRDRAELDDRVRISATAVGVGESEIGLVEGEAWSVQDLLTAVLVRSANDAAMALAEHVAGSVSDFVVLMNAKATELGLEHSHFANPHGLDAFDHYASAADLVVIARAVLADPVLAQMVRTRLVKFKESPVGAARIVHNTNALLGRYPGIAGMKTGYTGDAGRVLVSVLERNGRTLVAVVMGSEDHFADSRELLDWGYRSRSLYDRLLVPLLEEEGGGGLGSGTARLPDDVRTQVATVAPLPDGRSAVTPAAETGGALAIREWLRDALPVILGGSG